MFLPARPCLRTPLTARNLIRLLKFHSSIYTTGDRLWARRQISARAKGTSGLETFPLQILFSVALKQTLFCQCENMKNQQLGSQITSMNPP
jgi:hypothetical protein